MCSINLFTTSSIDPKIHPPKSRGWKLFFIDFCLMPNITYFLPECTHEFCVNISGNSIFICSFITSTFSLQQNLIFSGAHTGFDSCCVLHKCNFQWKLLNIHHHYNVAESFVILWYAHPSQGFYFPRPFNWQGYSIYSNWRRFNINYFITDKWKLSRTQILLDS